MRIIPSEVTSCFNLLGAIIDHAVNDFNSGNDREKTSAASFFRDSDEAKWMCAMVGAKPSDVVKARLKADPYAPKIKSNAPRTRCSKAEFFEWDGKSQTIGEWSIETGLSYYTLRARINKHGVCAKVFKPSRMANGAKEITWNGETMTIPQWAVKCGIKNDTLRARIKYHGVCDKVFMGTMPLSPVGVKPKLITWQGETFTGKQWAKRLNMSASAFHNRFYKFGLAKKTFTALGKNEIAL